MGQLPFRQKDPELEVDVADVVRLRGQNESVQIVDVRERDEWDAGHMPGSTLIPLGELAFRARELDADRPLVIVCRSGNRSLVAAEMLSNAGFKDAKSLAGGLIAWAEAGQELVR